MLYPENKLHAHELVNSAFAYSFQPFTIPKAASFLSLSLSLSLSKVVEYITNAVDMSGITWTLLGVFMTQNPKRDKAFLFLELVFNYEGLLCFKKGLF